MNNTPVPFVSGMDSKVLLPGPCGSLQALLSTPNKQQQACTAVICHPHPQQEGSMHNKVVHTLARACHRQGLYTVRFNYRGVGLSEGSFGNYEGELADCLAIIDWVKSVHPQHRIVLAGFSFGAYIATAAAVTESSLLECLITIAPAIHHKSYTDIEQHITAPWLIVQGLNDEVVPAQQVLTWQQTRVTTATMVTLATGHFFHGELIPLREIVEKFLAAQLPISP